MIDILKPSCSYKNIILTEVWLDSQQFNEDSLHPLNIGRSTIQCVCDWNGEVMENLSKSLLGSVALWSVSRHFSPEQPMVNTEKSLE